MQAACVAGFTHPAVGAPLRGEKEGGVGSSCGLSRLGVAPGPGKARFNGAKSQREMFSAKVSYGFTHSQSLRQIVRFCVRVCIKFGEVGQDERLVCRIVQLFLAAAAMTVRSAVAETTGEKNVQLFLAAAAMTVRSAVAETTGEKNVQLFLAAAAMTVHTDENWETVRMARERTTSVADDVIPPSKSESDEAAVMTTETVLVHTFNGMTEMEELRCGGEQPDGQGSRR
ncbi:MAG: hypothetical protein BJ554DRAFT_4485, partial [Olpidium bornovanus]